MQLMVRVLDKALKEKYLPALLSEINDAVQFAEVSPWPTQEQLLTDVI